MTVALVGAWPLGCGARTGFEDPGPAEPGPEDSGAPPQCAPGVPELAVAPDSLAVDLVAIGDRAEPDGQPDGVFATTIDGPVADVALVTVDASGNACCGQQWDTLVGDDAVPAEIGTRFRTGAETWVLGVERNGQWRSASDGTISAWSEGCSSLRLVAASSGYFQPGHGFRVYFLRPNGQVVASAAVPY